MNYAAAFAQPIVDNQGRRLLQHWYAAGARLFIGWASKDQTSGKDLVKDRAEQLKWRQAVRELGPDARYCDYILPDWQIKDSAGKNTGVVAIPTQQDLRLMLDDPHCFGIFGPDEPNLSPPTGGNIWRIALQQWLDYWNPVLAADPSNTKHRVADFAGSKLTASWQWGYKAQDVAPYLAQGGRRIITVKLSNWHPKNMESPRYNNDLPALAVRACSWVGSPADFRGAIVECADEELGKKDGRPPTPAEIWDQYQRIKAERIVEAEGNERHPIRIYCAFPQAPKPHAGHKFFNMTDEQFDMMKQIFADFAPVTPPPPTPDQEIEKLRSVLADLKLTVAGQASVINTLTEQSKLNHARIEDLNRPFLARIERSPADPQNVSSPT